MTLATVGLYGVMAYTVEQRTGEIGVRMALGADREHVVRMVLGNAFSQIGIGLALGIPAAIAADKFMTDQLFGVKPRGSGDDYLGCPYARSGSATGVVDSSAPRSRSGTDGGAQERVKTVHSGASTRYCLQIARFQVIISHQSCSAAPIRCA